MTVSAGTARNTYTAAGTTFPYTFRILAETHIQVILRDPVGAETTLTLGTDFTVDSVGYEGGNVETVEEYGSDYTIVLLRNVPAEQQTDYTENDEFPAEAHEEALDKLTMLVQQLQEELGRCVKVKKSSTPSGSGLELDPIASRAIGWDAAAEALTSYSPESISMTDLDTLAATYSGSLAVMVATLGAAERTVIVDIASALSADLTIPSNISLLWLKGVEMTIASGKTLTIEGSIIAGPYALFAGSGSVDLSAYTGTVYGEWTGDDGFRILSAGTELARANSNGLTVAAGSSINEFSVDGTLGGNSDKAIPTEKAVKTYVDGAVTSAITGSYLFWSTETPPDGYLECNGVAVSRTTYSGLFAVIAEMYGVGDGSTTFNLPDFRGRFPRGWAHGQSTDPDRASRTDRGDGTTGDHVGTKQADELKSHRHFGGEAALSGVGPGTGMRGTTDNYPTTYTGGNETRPINVNILVCIKY
jgi:hypothetical protein